MYIRTTSRKNKDGSVVRYVALAHNVWDPQAGCSRTEVIRNLGREDELEERLDGKYLIRTSDDTLSAVDVALGYKQLYQVENAFRTLKTTLELRPVYHRLEERIRAHVLLCWLALLLIRVMENQTGQSWTKMRRALSRIQATELKTSSGSMTKTTNLSSDLKQLFKDLKIP